MLHESEQGQGVGGGKKTVQDTEGVGVGVGRKAG
jgi:hypothetical protein